MIPREIEIRLPRCLLVFTEVELMTLLQERPEIWAAGLQRGKAHVRREQALQRGAKMKPERRMEDV